MTTMTATTSRYKQTGVDIDAGDALVEAIKPLAKSTARPGSDAGLGGFGGVSSLIARPSRVFTWRPQAAGHSRHVEA